MRRIVITPTDHAKAAELDSRLSDLVKDGLISAEIREFGLESQQPIFHGSASSLPAGNRTFRFAKVPSGNLHDV
jgi:hypothetical protein